MISIYKSPIELRGTPLFPSRRMLIPRREPRIWTPRQLGFYAGDIKQKYGTAEALTVTNLQGLASSSTFQAGWTSAWIDNTSTLALNSIVTGSIVPGTTPTAGSIRAYVYAEFPDGSDPDLFSSGTEGVEGAATIHDGEQLDASFVYLWSSAVDTTSDQHYPIPPRSIRQAFGFMPRKWALYIAHDTVAALKTSGNVIHVDHEIAQYT